jgi:hypothetical protein
MDHNDAFDFATRSFRHVRLLGLLNQSWRNQSPEPVGQLLDSWLQGQRVGNLDSFSFVNQHTLLTHLYMTVVWYVEHQGQGLFDDLFKDLLVSEIGKLNEQYAGVPTQRRPTWPEIEDSVITWTAIVSKKPEPRTLSAYFKHLRNAVAHGRVDFLDNGDFLFFDRYPGDPKPHTKLKMNFELAALVSDALYLSLALHVYPLAEGADDA